MKPYPTPPEGLQVVSAPPILTLTLDRPQRRNALTDDIVMALIDTTRRPGRFCSTPPATTFAVASTWPVGLATESGPGRAASPGACLIW